MRFPWGLWLLALPQAFARLSSDQIVELDLVFPRNDAYAPSPLTPVVFAVQNPKFVRALDATVKWNIEPADESDRFLSSTVSLSSFNSSTSDPWVQYFATSRLDTEGTWAFTWELSFGNCTRNTWKGSTTWAPGWESGRLYFTTKRGAPPPDLVAATSEPICTKGLSRAWNVTDTLYVPAGGYADSEARCAVVASPKSHA